MCRCKAGEAQKQLQWQAKENLHTHDTLIKYCDFGLENNPFDISAYCMLGEREARSLNRAWKIFPQLNLETCVSCIPFL